MNSNLYNQFSFERTPKNPLFYLADGTRLDYKTVDRKVSQYCRFFDSLNLKQGDRIVQQTEKCVDALCIYLAILKFGTIYIPLNPAFKTDELTYFINDSKPSLYVCSPNRVLEIQKIASSVQIDMHIESLAIDNSGSIQEKSRDLLDTFDTAYKNKDDIACILYTSGTTGQPKGAMLSHENLLSNAKAIKESWQFDEKDILLHMLPIFHCHGLFFSCHCVLLSGASAIFLNKFDINQAIKHLPNCTVLMGVPTYYTRLLSNQNFDKSLVKNVRLFVSGSAPLLKKTFYEFEERIGTRILERYGMTETGINATNPLNGNRVPGSVGIPLPIETLRIVDDNDEEVGADQPGHIQVKGPNIFCGYWEKPAKTAESFSDDLFFRTGDIGTKDKNNYVSIIGRAKDLIITGGLNVYPIEIEMLLDKMDGIKESAIIGLPHADFGEAVTAVIVPDNNKVKPTEESIILTLKEIVADYKIPKKIIFIDDLPRNTMSKVQKNKLRENFSDLYQEH